MSTIKEQRQALDFDAAWRVLKWDTASEFVGNFETALATLPGEGIKAADVVGVRVQRGQARTLLIGEFKDFNRPGPEAAQRSVSDDLARQVIRKVVDSLCGATFSHDRSYSRCEELDQWRSSLARPTTKLLVLVCVEVPRSMAAAATFWSKKLQKNLRWLGPNAAVIVTNLYAPFEGDGIVYRATTTGSP